MIILRLEGENYSMLKMLKYMFTKYKKLAISYTIFLPTVGGYLFLGIIVGSIMNIAATANAEDYDGTESFFEQVLHYPVSYTFSFLMILITFGLIFLLPIYHLAKKVTDGYYEETGIEISFFGYYIPLVIGYVVYTIIGFQIFFFGTVALFSLLGM